MDVIDHIEDELARQGARLDELAATLNLIGQYLDHVHADLVGVREQVRLYNPKCYEPAGDETPAASDEEE